MSETWGWNVAQGKLQWAARPLPQLPEGWARMQLVMGGVCGTDLQLIHGYAGFDGFLGHEFVGQVTECAQSEWVGRLVVGEINVGCGHCPGCRQGDARFCPERVVLGIRHLDGAFAQSFQLPVGNLFPVDDLDPQLACWAEPLAAALEVGKLLDSATEVVVLGDGRLGSLIALSLQSDHQVRVVGRHAHKLERLRSLGLDAVDTIRGQWPVVVEATGSAAGLNQALRLARPGGLVVIKSTVAQPEVIDTTPIVVNALRVVGSRCGFFGPALEAMRSGRVDPRPLVDQVLDLSEFPQAVERRDWVKVLLRG